jgi:NAD(P)-dependent dehydrogenase (short-subunit alcohol dehydrogenase family)
VLVWCCSDSSGLRCGGSSNTADHRPRTRRAGRVGPRSAIPTALIIGNSDGIGLALSELLLAEGWRVVGVSRSASRLERSSYEHHVCDVASARYAARLAAVAETLGTPDVCVYCAGIGEFLDLNTLATDRRVFEVNLMGAVTTAMVVIPRMVGAGHGHFIGLSSQADAVSDPNAPSYSASKAGLSRYLEALAPACRARGVYVTNVRFGFVDTKMAKSPVRPFLVPASLAAARVRACIDRRPVRHTFPKRMALLLWGYRLGVRLRRWLGLG